MEIGGDPLTIEADEQLLRQALFNLVLNAIQAVPPAGKSRSSPSAERHRGGAGNPRQRPRRAARPPRGNFQALLHHQPKGTGLGLAVVQQIVLAHGWEIECLANDPKGARFRITHLRTA